MIDVLEGLETETKVLRSVRVTSGAETGDQKQPNRKESSQEQTNLGTNTGPDLAVGLGENEKTLKTAPQDRVAAAHFWKKAPNQYIFALPRPRDIKGWNVKPPSPPQNGVVRHMLAPFSLGIASDVRDVSPDPPIPPLLDLIGHCLYDARLAPRGW